ncbi:MAG: hypothetical protein RL088_498 [Verrucomicrobiota bacterium]|jgi:hypothetical protein
MSSVQPSSFDPAPQNFGEYLVFVDESGDHELSKIDPQYPVFVLLFCIIRKSDYVEQVCPNLQRFKFEFWGHDEVVLHEHEIRKPHGDFLFLLQKAVRERFLAGLGAQMEKLPATVVAVLIDKPAFVSRYHHPVSPYDYAMETGLERVFRYMEDKQQGSKLTPIIVERRGRREDNELELAFRRVCDGTNALRKPLPFQLVMIPKTSNSPGLQLTDLMARPVGIHHLRPGQPNRAYDVIETKFRRSPDGRIDGWGLKRLP